MEEQNKNTNKEPVGPVLGIIIIIALVVVGGMVVLGGRINTSIEQTEVTPTSTETVVDSLIIEGTSTDVQTNDLELDDAFLNDLEQELNQIESELVN